MTAEPGRINDRWELMLLPHRVEFHAKRPRWEAPRLASCAERTEPGMSVWDIGAEEGDFTSLYRSWVGEAGRLVAIEPQPAYWPAIRQTWEANALGDPPGVFCGFASDITEAHPPRDALEAGRVLSRDGWPACSIGSVQPDFGFRHLAQQTDSTPQVTLDDLAELHGQPDVIVMDIEGAEVQALRGASELLASAPLLVYVSAHPVPMREWYGVEMRDLHELMLGHGYAGTYLGAEIEEFWLFEKASA
ncbi:MAG: FkbM family methyltransferase [Thermoleophilaceae bacterium]